MKIEPVLRLPPTDNDWFRDPATLHRRIKLVRKRNAARRWMWLNNIKERKYELHERR